MSIKLNVTRADLSFEAVFPEPQFALFQNTPGLLRHLFARLTKHGLRLQDMRIERGGLTTTSAPSVWDFHVLCYLFNLSITIRVRVDRVEVYWSEVPRDHFHKFAEATVDALAAVQSHLGQKQFSTHAVAVGLHAMLEGQTAQQYLSRFVANVPAGLGSLSGNGVVFYFGPQDERLLSSVTLDVSILVPGALYVRPQAVWDATPIDIATLPTRVESLVRNVLTSFDLELP